MKSMVGWKEYIALPDLGIDRLKCKVDTGAKNSALHAFEIEEFCRQGEKWIRFKLHMSKKDLNKIRTCEAKVFDKRTVSDSGGNLTERYFIRTTMKIGSKTIKAQLSLTSRDTMAFKMLLGRTALRKAEFVVDPAAEFLQGKPQ